MKAQTHSNRVQLDRLKGFFWLMAHVAGGEVGRRLHHPQQCLMTITTIFSAKPPAASGRGKAVCVCVFAGLFVDCI